jgi:LysR family glycine cleavage system transcriptional activator
MNPIPPLSSLRVFEAVVRLGGFRRAAEDLGVTQSAVSQQVRKLEEWLGRSLLIRGPRQSMPTADGRLLNDAIVDGLEIIGATCAELRRKSRHYDHPLLISTLPGFALKWLFPRLMRFDEQNPEIPISIVTDRIPIDFSNDQETLAIRYGPGRYPGLHVERLFGETLFPVCAPSLLERGPPLKLIEDLMHHTLLVDDIIKIGGKGPSWDLWFSAVGCKVPPDVSTRRFGQANMVVQAAVEGLGVALGREPLVIDELEAGRLVRPFDTVIPSDFGYYLVCPKSRFDDPRVVAFRDWLVTEATQMPTLIGSRNRSKSSDHDG